MLELPDGVTIKSATIAAGHLSSSTIYPACFAPYLVSTACSDGRVRFWHCKTLTSHLDQKVAAEEQTRQEGLAMMKYEWTEWEMMIRAEDTSAIKVAGD